MVLRNLTKYFVKNFEMELKAKIPHKIIYGPKKSHQIFVKNFEMELKAKIPHKKNVSKTSKNFQKIFFCEEF